MNEKLTSLKQEILDSIEKNAVSRATAFELRKKYLDSKTGEIGQLMKEMKNIPNEEKAEYGKQVNELKSWATEVFEDLDAKMKAKELKERYEKEKIDVTIDAECEAKGNLHPITQMRNQLIDVFAGMGFTIYEGTEIENDYYNFTALNTPADHPARDMQDTFYLSPEFLLRTQTSSGQIHVMENTKPPIKILSPGKVFRSDDDATHSPMFTQMEGLVVDKKITLCDLASSSPSSQCSTSSRSSVLTLILTR